MYYLACTTNVKLHRIVFEPHLLVCKPKLTNGEEMRSSNKTEGFSLVTSKPHIRDIEAHCRKVHAEAVIESFKIAFSAPIEVCDRLFSKEKKSLDQEQTAPS